MHFSRLKKTFLYLKDKFINKIVQLRLLFILTMLIKSILFVTLLDYSKSNLIDNISYSGVYLIFIIFIYSFGYILNRNKQITFYLLFNLLFSIFLIFNISYFRANGDFLGLKHLLIPTTFNPSQNSVLNFKLIDLTLLIDFIILVLIVKFYKINNIDNRNFKKFNISIIISLIFFGCSYFYFDKIETSAFGNRLVCYQYSPLSAMSTMGPLNYEIIHGSISLKRVVSQKLGLCDKNDEKIKTWLNNNKENLPDNEYKGIAKGKNVIILQVESLENIILNQTAEGQEITPFLNSLTKTGLYFNNIFEQNNGAHSIDCDYLLNTSVLTLGNRVSGTEYGENIYPNSLPNILSSEGYNSATAHIERLSNFNWLELHKNSFGVDKLFTTADYNTDETLGYGISDKSSLTQFTEKLKTLKQPFLAQTYTLTSHGPFNLNNDYRELNLPSYVDNNYLGGYFQSLHYADKQIELFFKLLKEADLLDNSLIVLIGDHTGVHKYYNDSIQSIDYDNNWWKPVDRKIPMIIYSSDIKNEVIEKHGGQIDVLPTLCYLLGIDDNKYRNTSMGRVLVNTNRDATIIKDTATDTTLLKGNIKDYKEERHLLDAYKTGEYIIKSNYFYRTQN